MKALSIRVADEDFVKFQNTCAEHRIRMSDVFRALVRCYPDERIVLLKGTLVPDPTKFVRNSYEAP